MGEIAVFCSGLALRGLWSLVEKGGADLLGWVMYPHHEIYYAFTMSYILIMSCSHRESKLHYPSILLLCYYVNNEIFSIIMHHVT